MTDPATTAPGPTDPTPDEPPAEAGLRRTLTWPGLVGLGLGATIGAGIFVLPGVAAARYAGPGLTLSFVAAGLACGLVGLCYAELAAAIPEAGSTYSYTRASLGGLAAWIVGWDLVLEFAFAAATVAAGWSGYARSLLADLGLRLPQALAAAPGEGGLIDLPAALLVLALTGLLMRGTAAVSAVNAGLVVLKLAVVLAFVAVGAAHVRPELWQPLVPENAGAFGQYGWSGILRGAGVVFFAFIGFETVATAAAESRDPGRDAPRGLLGSLALSTVLYVSVAAVLTGLVPYGDLDVPDPIARAVDAMGLGGFAVAIKLGALVGLTTAALTALFGQARIFYAMARDGLLPGLFARVDPVSRVPAASQAVIGLGTAALAGCVPLSVLGELVSIGTLLAFALVCVGALVLRRTRPDLPRPFRVPALPGVAGLGLLACGALAASLPPDTWLRLAGWLVLGLGIYAAYGRRHARRPRTGPT